MQDFIGSVRRSLVFTSSGGGEEPNTLGGLVGKIGSSIRRSRIGLFPRPMPPALPPIVKAKRDDESSIRWRKGELIGSGAFGQVYMGMNLDSGELLAVKQVGFLIYWIIGSFSLMVFFFKDLIFFGLCRFRLLPIRLLRRKLR